MCEGASEHVRRRLYCLGEALGCSIEALLEQHEGVEAAKRVVKLAWMSDQGEEKAMVRARARARVKVSQKARVRVSVSVRASV